MVLTAACVLSIVALVVTKAADLWTTWRFVGVASETNPLGRALMARLGMKGALAVVGVVAALLIATSWAVALRLGPEAMGVLAAWSTVVAVVQGAVALTNATGRFNLVTRRVLALHGWLHRR